MNVYISSIKFTYVKSDFLAPFSFVTIVNNPFLFTETHVHVCDFHREKAWNEWVSKTTNGVTESREVVLQYLRNIAKSANQIELEQNILMLKESQVWKQSVKLQKYFTEFWGLYLQVH